MMYHRLRPVTTSKLMTFGPTIKIARFTFTSEPINCTKVAGYRVVATDAPSRHRGGIGLFYREGADFAVEEVRLYGPNVISFEVVTGRRRWYIIGCYIAPDDARTIERVVTALGDHPRGTALIVAGDLNTDL